MITTIPVITIDGTSGSGKGTICKELANKFKWNILDSGAIYRTLALSIIHHKINIKSKHNIVNLALNLNIRFIIEQKTIKVLFNNKDVTNQIRTEIIGNVASKISVFPAVRNALLSYQRSFRVLPGLIADGRDMGTIVFPDASVKIFLNASEQERTKRRLKQLKKEGIYMNFKKLLNKIQERDYRDKSRSFSPLIAAKNALILDSTNMSIENVIKKILIYSKKKYNI